jgi:OmpA-OmpF porin, OOP family
MKKQMLALIAMVLPLIGVQGSEWDCNDCGDFYVGGFAGANFIQDGDAKAGFTGGVSLGYKFDCNLRLEGEFSYRRNSFKTFLLDDDDLKHNLNTHVQTYAAMANLLYDFDTGTAWTPYIGGGVGYAWNKFGASIDQFSGSMNVNGFAFQGIAGIAYEICEKTSVGLEYRYFQTKASIKDHSVVLALRRSF